MPKLLVLLIVSIFAVVGCGSPTGPSPGGGGEPEPVPANIPPAILDTSGGALTVTFDKMTPAVNGSVKVGGKALIWVRITNSSPTMYCGLVASVSNGPSDNPGQVGRSTADGHIFNATGAIKLSPMASIDRILGYQVSVPDVVPYLRLNSFCHEEERRIGYIFSNDEIGQSLHRSWVDIRLNWTLFS